MLKCERALFSGRIREKSSHVRRAAPRQGTEGDQSIGGVLDVWLGTWRKAGDENSDYIALGLLLAPPAVVVEMYLKDGTIGGWKLFIATAACWLSGGLVVLASHYWQSWRSADGRILPILIAAENKFWVRGLVVAASIGGALALSSFLSPPNRGELDASQKQIAALQAQLADAQKAAQNSSEDAAAAHAKFGEI